MPDALGAPDVSVVTSGHDVAAARLHREVAALQRAGLRVEVLGLGDKATGPPGATVRTVRRRGVVGRALLALELARLAAGRVLLTQDPDTALAAALVCRAQPGRRLVVDVQEDYAALLRDRAWARRWAGLPGRVGGVVVGGFQRVARQADLTVVADDHVPPFTARHRVVVRNLADPRLPASAAAPEPAPRALYVGDVRASRGLFAMLAAMRLLPDWTLDIVGPVAPVDEARLRAELARDALSERVRLHGLLPPAQAWALAPGAWVGLSLLRNTPAFADAMPSKLWEYMACGLPVVATDLRRQGSAVRESGAGVVVGTGEDTHVGAAVAAALRQWQQDTGSFDRARAAALTAGRTMATDTGYDDFAAAVHALARPAGRQ